MAWLEALGWAGSALVVVSLLQSRLLRFRVLHLLACAALVFYGAWTHVWPMVGVFTAVGLLDFWFMRRLLLERHDSHAFTVLEVGPLDEYLRHVLRVHAADIEAFQPGFVWDGAAPGHAAFLVLRDDEAVGVVLLRDAGQGVAQAELDYVTPRYRDFAPGEFVYRRSGLFRARGFHTVLTPPGMVEPYYARLGFERRGDSYVIPVG
ncbi:MAG TPA: hypothetical protein VFL99_16735 [Segeticoccus sp.]|uniref:hypothetical protein n=1 Tax=Segeticoccus sp. TaxID=2706531 RepID=UPI002D7E4836|nr:hypothetical protein [Segeticoccus sp.]HET8601973.1 hypothetical protein [Segeticoccus sp.]